MYFWSLPSRILTPDCNTYKGYSYIYLMIINPSSQRSIQPKLYPRWERKSVYEIYGIHIWKNIFKSLKNKKKYIAIHNSANFTSLSSTYIVHNVIMPWLDYCYLYLHTVVARMKHFSEALCIVNTARNSSLKHRNTSL